MVTSWTGFSEMCGGRVKRPTGWDVKELKKEETPYTKLIFHS